MHSSKKPSSQPELDHKTFRELALLAGFKKGLKVDTAALAKFYGVEEQTIKRWIKMEVATEATVRLLKLKILLVKQENWINHFSENYKKYEFIESLLNKLSESKIRRIFQYSDIKKTVLMLLINALIKCYTALDV